MADGTSRQVLLSFLLVIYVVVFGSFLEMAENAAHREVVPGSCCIAFSSCASCYRSCCCCSCALLAFATLADPALHLNRMFIFLITAQADRDGFESIPSTFWFVLATLTTVGYGDVYPLTVTGQVIGVICMFCGILVIGLPIVLIGNSFQAVFEADDLRCASASNRRSRSASLLPP